MNESEVEKIDETNIRSIFKVIEPELKRRLYLWLRYSREHQLQEYRNAVTEEEKAKQPVITSLEKSNTDIAAGYFLGKPVNYYNRNNPANRIEKRIDFTGQEREFLVVDKNEFDKYTSQEAKEEQYLKKFIEICNENNEARHNIDLAQDAFSCSTAYDIVYRDGDNIKFGKLDPTECTMIYSDEISSTLKPVGFMRRYFKTDYFTNDKMEVYELYTKKRRVSYTFKNDDEKPEIKGLVDSSNKELIYVRTLDRHGEIFPEIPITEYPMCERIGLYEQQIPAIEEYERTQTSTKRMFRFNEKDAKLLLSGINGEPEEGETKEQMVARILNSLILFNDNPEGNTDFAKWLTKNVDDTAVTHHKESLRADIFSSVGIFDPSKADTVYHSETGLKYKLYGLETKMSEFEHIFKEGLDRRRKIITELMNQRDGTDYDYRTIGVTFTRNIPLSMTEYATLAKLLQDVMPLEEIYKLLPMIENPSDMVERQMKWKLTLAKLEAEMVKIQAEATQNDIVPDRLQGFKTTNQNNGVDYGVV